MDILIVQRHDGSYQSTPFYVPFPKAVVGEKVELLVGGELVQGLSLHINGDRVVSCSDGDGANVELISRDQMDMLNLQIGENTFIFRTVTSKQFKLVCAVVWRYDCKIVVTDIDGTLTRSNLRGHLMPRLGFDWSHCSVSNFFQQLHKHGYKIIYLTARSINLNGATREYLASMNLPPGPLFPALKSIGHSLVSELFTETSKLSKVGHLESIVKLFPNSFVAGFGNNEKDLWTYTQVKIPCSRVFIINSSSRISCNKRRTSYEDLLQEIEDWFPEICAGLSHQISAA